MGASASFAEPFISPLKEVDVGDGFPYYGLELTYIEEFYALCGGKDALRGLTTTDVCERIIKPATHAWQCSFVELLISVEHAAVISKADVFISHAWKYEFVNVMDILQYHFRERPNVAIWFDLFTNNQHKAPNLDFEWWQTTFKVTINSFGNTVMVCHPWQNPLTFTRVWCLFEIYSTVSTNSTFQIALSEDDEEELCNQYFENGKTIDDVVAKIDLRNAECFVASDKEKIFSIVEEEVGISKLNQIILENWNRWTYDSISRFYHKRLMLYGENDERTLKALTNIVHINIKEEDLPKAEQYAVKLFNLSTENLPLMNEITLTSFQALARIRAYQEKFIESEELYLKCLSMYKTFYGEKHHDTAGLMHNYGTMLSAAKRFKEAEKIFIDVIEIEKEFNGEDTIEILFTKDCLAQTYEKQNRHEEAENIYLDCLEVYKQLDSEQHPGCLVLMSNLAVLYSGQERYMEAEELNLRVIECEREKRGSINPSIITTIHNLCHDYLDQGRFDEGKTLCEKYIQICETNLGNLNHTTIKLKRLLATCYMKEKNYEKVLEIGEDCLQTLKQFCDDDTPEIVSLLKSIKRVRNLI